MSLFLVPRSCNFIEKETLAQVLLCEFCKIFKNTHFYRTPPVTASELNSKYEELLLVVHTLNLDKADLF